jgi:hypothetical protein
MVINEEERLPAASIKIISNETSDAQTESTSTDSEEMQSTIGEDVGEVDNVSTPIKDGEKYEEEAETNILMVEETSSKPTATEKPPCNTEEQESDRDAVADDDGGNKNRDDSEDDELDD